MTEGYKEEDGKVDMSLLFEDMSSALVRVADVLTWACTTKANPYPRSGWLLVKDGQRRYLAAQQRHETTRAILQAAAWGTVEPFDVESNKSHLAHIACNALIRLEIACREGKA